MKEYTTTYVREIIDHLEQQGYITTGGEYHTLALTPAADELVRSRRTLLMKRPKRAGAVTAETVQNSADVQEDTELMQRLKELRKKEAAILGVPAYVVFTDASLREMSVKKPRDMHAFLNISGVGTMKAERYGRQFIAVVEKYISEKG